MNCVWPQCTVDGSSETWPRHLNCLQKNDVRRHSHFESLFLKFSKIVVQGFGLLQLQGHINVIKCLKMLSLLVHCFVLFWFVCLNNFYFTRNISAEIHNLFLWGEYRLRWQHTVPHKSSNSLKQKIQNISHNKEMSDWLKTSSKLHQDNDFTSVQ